jgi:hypothetical protein
MHYLVPYIPTALYMHMQTTSIHVHACILWSREH